MKKIILEVIVILSISLILASAQPQNWFSLTDIRGNITITSTGISKIDLDLGDLESTQPFSVSSNGSIIIGSSKGLNITKILLSPHLYLPSTQQSYWLERFTDLYANLTIENNTTTMKIIENSVLQIGQIGNTILGWRDVLLDSNGRIDDRANYCFYQLWNTYHLAQGIHGFNFTIFGETNLVTSTIPIEIHFELELAV